MPARSRPHSDPAGLGPGLSFLQVAESKVPKPACSTTSPSWPQAKCALSSTTPARCSPPNAATPTSSPCTTRSPPRASAPSSPSSSSWPRPGAADPSTRSPACSKAATNSRTPAHRPRRRPRLRRLACRRRRGYHRHHHHRRPPPGSRRHRRPRRPHPHRRLHRRQNPDLRNLTSTQSRLTGHGMWTTASGLGHPATPATDSAGADCAF